MHAFTVHWSPVPATLESSVLFCLWPSPVNHDVCFRDAGFTEFGDSDDQWDAAADDVLDRLLTALGRYGAPHLISEPVADWEPWYRRPFVTPRVRGLREQIGWPIHCDSLPDCVVAFGNEGVTLRSGSGHHLFWITVPLADADAVPALVAEVAGLYPLNRTPLNWECLLPKSSKGHRRQ